MNYCQRWAPCVTLCKTTAERRGGKKEHVVLTLVEWAQVFVEAEGALDGNVVREVLGVPSGDARGGEG